MRRFFRFIYRPRLFLVLTISLTGSFLFCNYCNQHIIHSSKGKVYSSVDEIPHNDVGLVLGTSKYLHNKYLNPYFINRLKAAISLYESAKIDHIIVSGDNSTKDYDEPSDMKNYLIEAGIPAESITCDYAGFRTFDSMVRAKKIFGQQKLTIISQQFHNERALYICEHIGIEAIAFNAKEVYRGPKSKLREFFAKTKAFLDLRVLAQEPKFLGEPIELLIQVEQKIRSEFAIVAAVVSFCRINN